MNGIYRIRDLTTQCMTELAIWPKKNDGLKQPYKPRLIICKNNLAIDEMQVTRHQIWGISMVTLTHSGSNLALNFL